MMIIRWFTQVIAFISVAVISEASSEISIPKRLRTNVGPVPISSRAVTTMETNDALNPATVFVEFLNRCSGANLDMETCLVSSTVTAFMDIENGPERKLQTDEEGSCGGPDINEQGLRLVMDGTKTQCIQLGGSISNEEFESAVAGFMTIFQSDCFCADDAESRLILMEITLDAVADCAQVDLDMPQCLKDHVVLTLSSANPGMDSATTDGGIQRKLRDLAASSTCDHSTLIAGLAMYAATMLEEGKAKCAAVDVSIGSDQLIKAHSALVSIFSAKQCWGMNSDTGCEEGTSDDEHGDTSGGINGIGIAIRYIEQCAGLEMNTDSCLTSSSMSAIFPVAFSQSQPIRGRILQLSEGQADCISPSLDELTLRYIVGQSALQCMSTKGVDSSEQEIEQTVNNLTDFFGAQECWAAFCEEQAHPSAEMYKLIFEEVAQCAGAHLNWNPCLMDQIFALLMSSGTSNDSLERVRRNLQGSFEPCANESNEAEFTFVVNMLSAGAEQNCLDLGEMVAPSDVAEAQAQLLKLFTAQQCWGTQIDCAVPENDYRSAYLTFIEERINMVLSDCVGAETSTCVFNRSIEVMNGMKILGWSLDGRSDLFQQVTIDPSALCVAPSINEDEVHEIAKHAQVFCVTGGTLALDSVEYDGTIKNLNSVVTDSNCWDELCQSSIKDFILEEWMDHCTTLNLKFLFTQVQSNSDLDTDLVECMVSYILSKEEETNASVICEHPHGDCGMDIGEEAFLHCGGNINLPTTTKLPPIQFSMNFGIDDWFPSGQNDQEVGAYVIEACSVIEYLHSSMTMSCLQPVCDGLWIEDTLTVTGSNGADDDGTDDKTTIVEAPSGTSLLTPQPTRKPTPNPSSKSTPPPVKTNDSPASGYAAALYLAGVMAFTSLIII